MGTKSGELALYDIAASSLLATYKAHTGPIWSIHVKPDGKGLVSGSADKDVKFWDFEMREAEGEGERVVSRLGVESFVSRACFPQPKRFLCRIGMPSFGPFTELTRMQVKNKQLTLVHVRTLKMTDDVLAVKFSPDGRFLAVSLLDSTVKVFFADTLKFFLSLYGHKVGLRVHLGGFLFRFFTFRPYNLPPITSPLKRDLFFLIVACRSEHHC